MSTTYEAIVVGGGGSGLATAVSAAENGCSVLVLEKQPFLGGTTGLAVGSFTANGTEFQRRAGIDDSPTAHAEDAARFAPPELEARNNEPLRRFFLEHSGETLAWLDGMGLAFFGPSPEPPNRVPRMHNVVPGARAYILAMRRRLRRLGGRIECAAPVLSLVRVGDKIAGVRARMGAQEREFRATLGVVLAAGDYANSSALIAEFKGDRFSAIEGINVNAGGDGQLLARSVGAKLVNMDVTYGPEIRFVPSPRPSFWQHPENALFTDGAILLNSAGDRFCNEERTPDREIAISAQPGKRAYILLDERLRDRYSVWPHFISTAPRIAYAYVSDYEKLRPDVARSGASLRDVASAAGLPVQAVERSVARFNEAATRRTADAFGRSWSEHTLQGTRWTLFGPAKSYFTTTEGGPAITTGFEVLDEAGRPIPGLYAVGQNGIGGQILWGHGLHIGWALTSGRLMGRILAGHRPQ